MTFAYDFSFDDFSFWRVSNASGMWYQTSKSQVNLKFQLQSNRKFKNRSCPDSRTNRIQFPVVRSTLFCFRRSGGPPGQNAEFYENLVSPMWILNLKWCLLTTFDLMIYHFGGFRKLQVRGIKHQSHKSISNSNFNRIAGSRILVVRIAGKIVSISITL